MWRLASVAPLALRFAILWQPQPLAQLRPPPTARNILHSDRDGLGLADEHDQLLAASDAGVEQVPLQHDVGRCQTKQACPCWWGASSLP